MNNAGKYNKKIKIIVVEQGTDKDGFPVITESPLLEAYASVKTTKGFTLIANNSDFEKALTNFTIRYAPSIEKAYLSSNRNLKIEYNNKKYTIEYLNNVDEANTELEMQCKKVVK